ncbi:MAG TPA: hypothetical protein ENG54_00645, partial [Thermofilum sp.]|nr:hypothetical protein [Thermofilum sp.]
MCLIKVLYILEKLISIGKVNLLRSVVGVILCGGRGEALKPLSNYLQKAMLPVGSLEKPVLEYIIRHMVYHGITNIALL